MSGVLRLGNTGAGTGRSTLEASASNDQTFTLPSAGGTLLTSNTSIPGGTITLDGANVNITNGDLNVDSGTLFVDESTSRVGIGLTNPAVKFHIKLDTNKHIRFQGNIGEIGNVPGFQGVNDAGGLTALGMRGSDLRFATGSEERMRIDSSGRVGINTTTFADTATALVIKNGASASEHTMLDIVCDTNESSRVRFSEDGTTFPGEIRYNTLGHDLLVTVNASERLRINSDGSIDVGTGTEATNAGTPANSITLFTGATNEEYASVRGQYNRGNLFNQSEIRFGVEDNANGRGFLSFATGANSTTEQARIDSQGRLLIGTTTSRTQYASQSYLQVVGQEFDNSTIALRRDQNNSNPPGIIFAKSRSASIGGNTIVQDDDQIGTLIFCPADGTDVRNRCAELKVEMDGAIANDQVPGRMVFRTTSVGNSAPTTRLTIKSNGGVELAQNAAFLDCATQTGYVIPIQIQNTGNNTQATLQQFTGWNGTVIGEITGFVNQTNYVTSSDYRLKENTVKVTNGIERVKQLQPRSFNFIENPDLTLDGFFAHEVQEIVPNAVTGKHNEVDEEGKPVYQGMDHSKLVPLLTAALQEAITRIEDLESEVSKLRSN